MGDGHTLSRRSLLGAAGGTAAAAAVAPEVAFSKAQAIANARTEFLVRMTTKAGGNAPAVRKGKKT